MVWCSVVGESTQRSWCVHESSAAARSATRSASVVREKTTKHYQGLIRVTSVLVNVLDNFFKEQIWQLIVKFWFSRVCVFVLISACLMWVTACCARCCVTFEPLLFSSNKCLLFISYLFICFICLFNAQNTLQHVALSSPAMGHWGTCPPSTSS